MLRVRALHAVRCISTMSTTPVEDAMRAKVYGIIHIREHEV